MDTLPTITELARAYRSGEADPRAVTEACLTRIDARDARLRAFVTVTGDAARAAAERAARELAAGIDRGPLHGIPIAVKDLIDVAGVPTGFGSAAAFRTLPAKHAALVERLEAAGAVIVGKTNLLEFAYGAVHPDVGDTRNPLDITRTAGGSSGGSAAAVAAGMAVAAIGTDTGGSIRIPAAYCGVVGHKPTFGSVPLRGVFPLSWSLDHAGPIARTSACALSVWEAIADDAGAGGARGDALGVAGRRFAVLRDHTDHRAMRSDVRAAFDDACHRLRAGGATLVEVRIPELAGMADTLLALLLPEAAIIHAPLSAHADAYGAQTRAQLAAGDGVTAMAYLRARAHQERLRAAFDDALHGVDALLSPTAAWVAPSEDPPVDGEDGHAEMLATGPTNLTGHPSVSIPAGRGEGGLPVGLQLTGPRGGDRRLLRLAQGAQALLPAHPTG